MTSLDPTLRLDVISTSSPHFAAIRSLRRDAYGRPEAETPEAIDEYSFHVIAVLDGAVVGSLRVTCRQAGPLEAEQFYPPWLLDEFGGRLVASSRLCVRRGVGTRLPLLLMRRAWQHAIEIGMRVDVSKVRRRAIPYYLRIGAYYLRDSCFLFERWNVECGLVAMPVNPSAPSPFVDLFSRVPDPCGLAVSEHSGRFTRDVRDLRTIHADV